MLALFSGDLGSKSKVVVDVVSLPHAVILTICLVLKQLLTNCFKVRNQSKVAKCCACFILLQYASYFMNTPLPKALLNRVLFRGSSVPFRRHSVDGYVVYMQGRRNDSGARGVNRSERAPTTIGEQI